MSVLWRASVTCGFVTIAFRGAPGGACKKTQKVHPMRTAEQEAVLRSVRKLVDFWQIQAHELGGIEPPVAAPAPVVAEPARPSYRHPISGETWHGEGSQPEWLKAALTREGYTVEELRMPSTDGPATSG